MSDKQEVSDVYERHNGDTSFIRGVCQAFLVALIEKDLLVYPELILLLEDEARQKGYAMECHQYGIRGTHVNFVKLGGD